MNISIDEYKMLVNGQFKSFKCTNCDGKGWYFVSGDGVKRDPKLTESHDYFYKHQCNGEGECGGVGFRVVFDE